MLISPIRKTNIFFSLFSTIVYFVFTANATKVDAFFLAELFFNAWVIVLVILLSIMIASLFPFTRFSSHNWHQPSSTISPLAMWREPINFIHYIAMTAIMSAILGGSITVALSGNIVYPLYVFSIGCGMIGGLYTAPLLFKGYYAGDAKQP